MVGVEYDLLNARFHISIILAVMHSVNKDVLSVHEERNAVSRVSHHICCLSEQMDDDCQY
ncbi:hypothetical protein C0J52_01047 [Blattella germanica]|nr:hypothetical protein C0J52_01047 [Blattella germanica]